jgi:hypothetical protein
LTTAEEKLLNFERKDNLPSSEVPTAYRRYIEDAPTYIGGIYKTIEHNFYDVINLERLLSKWMQNQIEEFYHAVYSSKPKEFKEILAKLKTTKRPLRSYTLDPFLE